MAGLVAGAPLRWCDLVREYEDIGGEIREAMDRVCKSAAFILGPDVAQLETALASFTGAAHCVSVSSGTAALEVLYRALGIGHGHEVITVPFTWVSTAETISLCGAKPVFVDAEPDSFNMDPSKLEAAIRPGVTKAVVAVSFHGQCPRSEALAAICARHGIPLLEDGAQSFGATRGGLRSCGSVPGFLASTTSFYPAKPYGCYGDGGAIFTSDADLALRLKSIRAYGGLQRDNYEVVGTNARLDTIQAAVLLIKLKYYPDVLAARQQVARWYDEDLAGSGCVLPMVIEGNTHTYAQYTVAVHNRAPIMQALKDAGIPHGVYYATPLHLQKCFADLGYTRGAFPISERLCDTVLSLPIHQYITRDQVKAVVGALKAAIVAHGGALTLEELRTGVVATPTSALSPSLSSSSSTTTATPAPHHPPFSG